MQPQPVEPSAARDRLAVCAVPLPSRGTSSIPPMARPRPQSGPGSVVESASTCMARSRSAGGRNRSSPYLACVPSDEIALVLKEGSPISSSSRCASAGRSSIYRHGWSHGPSWAGPRRAASGSRSSAGANEPLPRTLVTSGSGAVQRHLDRITAAGRFSCWATSASHTGHWSGAGNASGCGRCRRSARDLGTRQCLATGQAHGHDLGAAQFLENANQRSVGMSW